MKKLVFVLGGAAILALGGCNSKNDDAVNNAELNQPAADDLNAIANDAAANAEDVSLGNANAAADQNAAATVTNNSSEPSDADEQNVSGM